MSDNRWLKIPGSGVLFLLLTAACTALAWLAFDSGAHPTAATVIAAAIALLLPALWYVVVKPRRMVMHGMELLSGQETNNRLTLTGQQDADRIVSLFNTLMERLHQEQLRLREQNTFLHLLINASPMGIAILDFDGLCTDVNPAFIRLASLPDPNSATGLTVGSLPSPIARALGALADGETRTVRLDDTSILRCSRLSFVERGFRRPFILIESLTEEVMEARRQAYGKVIRLMSHEVNNSMTGIVTLLQILADVHCDDPEMSDCITSVSDRCDRLGRFIAAYADVVRLPDPILLHIDLCAFIDSQLPFLRSCTSCDIGISHPDTPLTVAIDADMMSQTLVNLIRNSTDAIRVADRSDGHIRISLDTMKDEGVQLTVTDNGCGISDEVASNLFTPFYSSKPDGQGIGLTMTAEILRRHNARFSLRTGNDGLTRFNIIFPCSHHI